MTARLMAFVLWALAAGSAVYWGLRVFDRPVGLPAGTLTVGASTVEGSVMNVLGASPQVVQASAPVVDTRFRLVGVIAPDGEERGRSLGVALIAIDEAPARAYPVGAEVTPGWVLQSVERRRAVLQADGSGTRTELLLPSLTDRPPGS